MSDKPTLKIDDVTYDLDTFPERVQFLAGMLVHAEQDLLSTKRTAEYEIAKIETFMQVVQHEALTLAQAHLKPVEGEAV